MTDSSSNEKEKEAINEMAAEMFSAKMEAANSKFTHLLRVGTFQMEVAPNEDIDVREFNDRALGKLIAEYGEKLLQIDISQTQTPMGTMHG